MLEEVAATLLPWLTVLDNVLVPAKVQRLPTGPARERAHELLASVGLADFEDQYPSELSGGMQQRVAITRALLHDPRMLLMDEPCSALDPISTLAIEDLISTLKQDYTIVIVTHNMQQAARVSDQTAFFNLRAVGEPGQLVEIDETGRIFSNPNQKATEDYISGRFG